MAGNIFRSIFQTFNPFKKGMQDQLSTQREVDRGEIEVDSYFNGSPSSLGGATSSDDANIFAIYLASLKISDYRDKIYDNYSAIRSNYIIQSILEIMTDDCLRPDKSTGNIINITSKNPEWNKELIRLQDRVDFDSIISDITPDILLYGEYAQHIIFEKGVGVTDLEDVYDIKNILPMYKGGKISSYLVKSNNSETAGNVLLPETMSGVSFDIAPIYKYVYFVRSGKRIRVKASKQAQNLSRTFELERVSGNVRIGRSVIPSSLIPLVKSLTTLEVVLPLIRILQLDKRSLIGIRFPGVTKLERCQNTVQEYERMINDTWRTANIATTGEFNVQDLISSITKFRVIPLLGEKGCFTGDTPISLYCGADVKIKDLVGKNFIVYSYDLESNQIVPGKAHNCHMTKKGAKVVAITLDNDQTIKCTYDHKFLARGGTYKEAWELVVGDSMMPLYRRTKSKYADTLIESVFDFEEVYQPGAGWRPTRDLLSVIKPINYKEGTAPSLNHKITKIEDAGVEDVYDFTVEGYHNFGLGCGIFVHNSIEIQDIPSPEIGRMDDFEYLKRTIFEGIGVPPQGGDGSKETLKTYVKYLKKLASIQRSLVVGIKHIAVVHLRALGHKALQSDINVEFANLVSIENLDELEYLDILTSLLRNYWEFVRDMDDVEGPTPGIVNWGEVMTFLHEKMRSFAGSEKFLSKNVEYFRKMGVLPSGSKLSGGVGGSSDRSSPSFGGGGSPDNSFDTTDRDRGDSGFKIVPPKEAGKSTASSEKEVAGSEYEEPTAKEIKG